MRGPPPALSASRIVCSFFAPRPFSSRSWPASQAALSASGESIPSSAYRRLAVFGPTPGTPIISTRPSGYFSRSFSSACSVPVSRYSSTFAAIVAPMPGRSVRRPSSAIRSTDSAVVRNWSAARRYAITLCTIAPSSSDRLARRSKRSATSPFFTAMIESLAHAYPQRRTPGGRPQAGSSAAATQERAA